MNGHAIRAHGLACTFGKGAGAVTAVDGIDLAIPRGEIFGFLGPNGAGKSTTINMLCTLLTPTAGHAEVVGYDVRSAPHEVRQRIGLVFQDPSLDERLTARENMAFHAMLYGVPRQVRRKRIPELLDLVSLETRADDLVRDFSGGMRRRLEIARGLLHEPELLFLDEPTLGLDPQTRNLIWDYVLELQRTRGLTLFLTTHYMEEAEHCDRIGIIDHGRLIALDTPEALKSHLGHDRVDVGVAATSRAALAAHVEAHFGASVTTNDTGLSLEVPDGAAFLPQLFATSPVAIERVSVHRPTLEDVFISLTGREIRNETADPFAGMKATTRRGGRVGL